MAGRLLIIGLDAGTFDVLDPLVRSGDMPVVGEILSGGARSELLSTFPPTTAPAWPTMVTSLGPAKLGLFGLLNRRPGTQYDFQVARNTFDGRAMWRLAGLAGVPVVACGIPGAFPPVETPNATVVTGMLTPNGYTRTAPEALEEDLAREGLIIDWEELRDLDGAVGLPDDEARLALYLMDRLPWRIFFTVFRGSDAIFHTHPGESEARREMFRRIDGHVGAMRSRLGPDDVLMLVSDHGMTELRGIVHVNSILEREGLLTRAKRSADATDRAYGIMERFKRSPVFDNAIVKNAATKRLAERLRRRTLQRRLEFGREGKRQPRLSASIIDWNETTCFFVDLGYGSGIYLNLAGREPLGIVDPSSYESTRARIAALLEAHEGIVVRRREDVYAGPYVDRAPDLLVSTSREELGLSGRMLDMPARTAVDVPYFHHTRRGIWVAYGAGVRAGVSVGPFDIADVCATVLHFCDAGVPDDVDGSVRVDFFDESAECARRPVRLVRPVGALVGSDDEFDDEAIKEQLRGLGYMN